MIDIKFLIQNPDLIKKEATKKQIKIDINKIIKLYEEKNNLLQEIEDKRAKQNKVSKEIPKTQNKEKLLKEMQKIKKEIKALEPKITKIENELEILLLKVPNPTLPSVPEGKDESYNEIIKTVGEKRIFDFSIKNHIELGKSLNIIDIERGVRTSGSRFYYLKNEGALLELALVQFAINKLVSKGFSPIIPPVLVKQEAMYATGFFPADKNEIYSVNPSTKENPEGDDLFLIGTSEVSLNMLHYTEILKETNLPLRYCGFSNCFRREAGSYGKDTAGVIRVHQFNKVEMFSFCHPNKSEAEHDFLLSIEEEIVKELGLHYQVVNIASGELGAPAAKKYDIEVWLPSQECFREITSCSNCTDFQARRSQIKYRKPDNKKEFLHTLNGTAIASPRLLVAIIENYQTKDGKIKIPEALQPYIGNKKTIEPK